MNSLAEIKLPFLKAQNFNKETNIQLLNSNNTRTLTIKNGTNIIYNNNNGEKIGNMIKKQNNINVIQYKNFKNIISGMYLS